MKLDIQAHMDYLHQALVQAFCIPAKLLHPAVPVGLFDHMSGNGAAHKEKDMPEVIALCGTCGSNVLHMLAGVLSGRFAMQGFDTSIISKHLDRDAVFAAGFDPTTVRFDVLHQVMQDNGTNPRLGDRLEIIRNSEAEVVIVPDVYSEDDVKDIVCLGGHFVFIDYAGSHGCEDGYYPSVASPEGLPHPIIIPISHLGTQNVQVAADSIVSAVIHTGDRPDVIVMNARSIIDDNLEKPTPAVLRYVSAILAAAADTLQNAAPKKEAPATITAEAAETTDAPAESEATPDRSERLLAISQAIHGDQPAQHIPESVSSAEITTTDDVSAGRFAELHRVWTNIYGSRQDQPSDESIPEAVCECGHTEEHVCECSADHPCRRRTWWLCDVVRNSDDQTLIDMVWNRDDAYSYLARQLYGIPEGVDVLTAEATKRNTVKVALARLGAELDADRPQLMIEGVDASEVDLVEIELRTMLHFSADNVKASMVQWLIDNALNRAEADKLAAYSGDPYGHIIRTISDTLGSDDAFSAGGPFYQHRLICKLLLANMSNSIHSTDLAIAEEVTNICGGQLDVTANLTAEMHNGLTAHYFTAVDVAEAVQSPRQ